MIKQTDKMILYSTPLSSVAYMPHRLVLGLYHAIASEFPTRIFDTGALLGEGNVTAYLHNDATTSSAEQTTFGIEIDSQGFFYSVQGFQKDTNNIRKVKIANHEVAWSATLVATNNSDLNAPNIAHFDGPTKCKLTHDERYLYVVSGQDGSGYTIRKYNTSDGSVEWQAGSDMGNAIAVDVDVDPDGNAYVVYHQDSPPQSKPGVRIYDESDGSVLYSAEIDLDGLSIAVSPDGVYFYAGFNQYTDGPDYNLHKYDIATLTRTNRWGIESFYDTVFNDLVVGNVWSLTVSEEHQLFAYVFKLGPNPEARVHMWDSYQEPDTNEAYADAKWYYEEIVIVAPSSNFNTNFIFVGEYIYNFAYEANFKTVGRWVIDATGSNAPSSFVDDLAAGASAIHGDFYQKDLLSPASEDNEVSHGQIDCGGFLEPQENLSNDNAEPVSNYVTDDIICSNYLRDRHFYQGGVFKARRSTERYFGDQSIRAVDDWTRLSYSSPRPFNIFQGDVEEANIPGLYSLRYYQTNSVGAWVLYSGTYYKCIGSYWPDGFQTFNPPSAKWSEVDPPSRLGYEDYPPYGGLGNEVNPLTTPHFYTIIVTAFAGGDAWLNGIYHLIKTADVHDGTWKYHKRRIGTEECEITFQLGKPGPSGGGGSGIAKLSTDVEIKAIAEFATYNQSTNYSTNNKVMVGKAPFIATAASGPATAVKIPLVTAGWEAKWDAVTTESTLTSEYLLNIDSTDDEGWNGTHFHYGCVFELHNESPDTGAGKTSWYPGDRYEWDAGKTYSNIDVVVYNDRFYKSNINDNTSEPSTNWTLLDAVA